MSNPFGKIVGFIRHAAAFVSNAFISLFGHDNAVAFGHAALSVLDSALGQIVVKAVAAVESLSPSLDGATKKVQAFSAVLTEAEKQGISAKNSLVNMLIELAVQAIAGSFAKAPVSSVVEKFSGADPAIGEATSSEPVGSSTSGE